MKKALIIGFVFILFVSVIIVLVFVLFPKKYKDEIDTYATKYGLDKYLVASVINIESSYDRNAVSKSGAVGLMQLLPTTAVEVSNRLGYEYDYERLFDANINIELGCFYLSYLLNMFEGNVVNSLCAYNWGLSNVKEWIASGNVDETNTITNIPVNETNDYIKKFNLNKFIYKNIYKY